MLPLDFSQKKKDFIFSDQSAFASASAEAKQEDAFFSSLWNLLAEDDKPPLRRKAQNDEAER